MDLNQMSIAAVSYLVASLKKSSGVKQATDELSSGLWNWIRPIFIKDDEPLADIKIDPDSKLNQEEIVTKVEKFLTKNPNSVEELEKILSNLQDSELKKSSLKITQNHYGTGDNVGGDKIVGR